MKFERSFNGTTNLDITFNDLSMAARAQFSQWTKIPLKNIPGNAVIGHALIYGQQSTQPSKKVEDQKVNK